jgi:dephospho-CoA kinase
MKIFVIVGMPASGKNIARDYAEKNQYPYFSTGDIVRSEIEKLNLKADAGSTAIISDELRGKDGLGVTRTALNTAINVKSEIVFLEGIRSWPEVELIKHRAECILIAVVAPKEVRYSRVRYRGRADDSTDLFNNRDRREIDYGVAACIALADEYVLNTDTMENAFNQFTQIVQKSIGNIESKR